MKNKLRPLTIVKLTDVATKAFANSNICHKYLNDLPLVFIGEIKNMPEHGIFVGLKSGKIYSGHHINDFEEIPNDEV